MEHAVRNAPIALPRIPSVMVPVMAVIQPHLQHPIPHKLNVLVFSQHWNLHHHLLAQIIVTVDSTLKGVLVRADVMAIMVVCVIGLDRDPVRLVDQYKTKSFESSFCPSQAVFPCDINPIGEF